MSITTVEMVGKGHPDKVADQISDSVLDWCLKRDPAAHVAIETMLKNNKVYIAGELTARVTPKKKDYKNIIETVFNDVKYEYKPKIILEVSSQSPDIAQGVNHDNPKEQGAGDQGVIFGYATNETVNYMPLAYNMARVLMQSVDELNRYACIKGDGKCQVTINDDNKIVQIVVSKQTTDDDFLYTEVHKILDKKLVSFGKEDVTFKSCMANDCKVYINPTGKFEIGGPFGDTGLTGRKIIVDTYGGIAHHGGGAFSGKDLSKVDRSGAYYARALAIKTVEAGIANKVELRMSFVIGKSEIADITCTYCDTGDYKKVQDFLEAETKDLTVAKMVSSMSVPSFYNTAKYGHFGRSCFYSALLKK